MWVSGAWIKGKPKSTRRSFFRSEDDDTDADEVQLYEGNHFDVTTELGRESLRQRLLLDMEGVLKTAIHLVSGSLALAPTNFLRG